ncbi:unnamed protein product [Spodoptera littoralis]|uniref:Uncharacterized protein n=1 Tax=Spodoptera littoralis TaxID=7109 RepID=A0A9P0I181_SPOLI|nr:unnamed protein product [Spodoptera littoralis]CAH1637571.1 unnamed protein product [Spodoptera littoralis]
MNVNKYLIILKLLLFSGCLCEISEGEKEKLLNGFLEHYNSLPNQIYQSNEGSLQNTQQVDDTTYEIVAKIKVKEIQNAEVTKSLTCAATVKDSDDHVAVTSSHCHEPRQDSSQEIATEAQAEVAESVVERRPVQLDNEVQSDTAITSGEQFIAIPRDQPSVPCFGCATHVNPQAAGVSDLASLGLRHLDIHQPTMKHTLERVLDVERQVQVVNGVRYILTMSVHFDNCSDIQSENCVFSNICKITFLVKPWVKLPNGANYRAILGNNCTEEWLYGDNGEVLPDTVDNQAQDKDTGSKGDDGDDIQVKYNSDVQSQPNMERTLTDEEMNNLEEQIIPNNQFQENYQRSFTASPDTPGENKEHVFKVESSKHNVNTIPVTEQTLNINLDKKKTIDDLLNYFDFSGFKLKTESTVPVSRARRSYDYDLQLLTLAEDYHGIKNSLKNARFVYGLAQTMVNYLNEIDMEVKNREVKSVIKAEEETDSLQRYIYVQASVTIPCDKVECEPRDTGTQICNGVLDATNDDSPQIISSFCYNDNKERDYRDIVKEIPLDDPVLQNLALDAVKKIESESNSENALKVNKIISALTQITSGTLTKFSIVVDNLKCNKSVPQALRINCTVLEQLGSQICEIIVHERHWLRETKISYSCTDRPVDMKISKVKSMTPSINVEDPKIIEMLQEAIQFLETQSEKNNKQKIVNVTSISSQIIAGFLTKIEFLVGYTNCTSGNELIDESNKCHLLKGQNLRLCKAQFWDRSWIIDGRQVEVSCDDVKRKKRSVDFVEGQGNENKSPENKYKKLANESLQKFMQSSLNHQHYEVVKVDKVDDQNLPDKLIRIQFSISPTNCKLKHGILSPTECHVINPENVIHCRSKILENVWVDKKQLFVNCNLKDYRQHETSSGLHERDSDSKYYSKNSNSLKQILKDTNAMHIAVEALQAYLKKNPESLLLRVTLVDKVVIEGLTTKIVFLASHTEDDDGDTICYAEFFATNTSKGVTEVKCHSIGLPIKRTEVTDEDPNYYKYIQLADESLYIHLQKINSSQLYTVASIESVMVQWDEGIKTQINFIISPTDLENHENQGKQCRAEIREQPWIHKKNINVKCELERNLYRSKRQIHDENNVEGGLTDQDPNDPNYRVLAEESLLKFVADSGTTQPLKVLKVEKVTTQVVSGLLTRIDFVISGGEDINKCHSKIWEQPWMNRKDIDVSCHNGDQRSKREAMTGGLTDQDPNDPNYRVLAEESLLKFVADSGTTQPLKVLKVEKVTTQVVSGLLTRIDFVISGGEDINKCHSKIWEQPWMNRKDIDVSCHNGDQRSKRQAMPGGLTDQDPNDPNYRVLAEESLLKYVADSGTTKPLKVVKIEKVTTQVVSGWLTRIDFVISGGDDINKCHSKIWEQPWMNRKDIDVSCHNGDQRSKREAMTGGLTDQDPNDPNYRVLAEESLLKFVADSGTTQPLKVIKVQKVTTQVVSGLLTRIDFVISGGEDINKCHSKIWEQPWMNRKDIDVSCHNGDQRSKREAITGGSTEKDPNDAKYRVLAEESLLKFCDIGGEDINKCHSKIWEQPWMNRKDIDVSCHNGDQRSKREAIPGGSTEKDPNDAKYRVLAEESLLKFVADSGTTQPLKVIKVEKVTTQVVSGLLTRIDFVISGGEDINKCHSKIWEQPWMNRKDIDVSCHNGDQRRKREAITGGFTDQDPNDAKYRVLAEESLLKFVADSGTTQPLKVIKVEKVTTQVVSGLLTRIDFVISGGDDINKCHSKIWEQPWMNRKDIDVSCHNGDQRSKREAITGGSTEKDPNDAKYRVLAEESLLKFVADSGTTQPLKVIKVEKVTTQVVSGLLTRIDFVISGGEDINKCHSKIWEQPWMNRKDIDVSCHNGDQRSKREAITGGSTEKDPNDAKYRVLAEESLLKFVADSGTTQPLKVIKVEKVTTQVVSGLLTRIDFVISGGEDINKCHSKIWEQPWMNRKDIDVSCHNGDQRSKREAMTGGFTDQDPNDAKYRVLAEESLLKFVADSGTTQPLKVIKVEKVTTQVVSGLLTRIDFVISGGEDINKCHSKIWEQPWMNRKDIDVSCHNGDQRSKREAITGGSTEKDPNDAKYRVLAEESLLKFVADSGTTQPLKVINVEKVTTQVVSGLLTRIDFVISGGEDINKCHSKIWEQPWMNRKDIDVSCHNGDQRSKREAITGGSTEKDPNDAKYRVLAEESLLKFVADSGTTQPLKVIKVEKVTTQVVSGLLTRIDFVISGGEDINKCHSKIWEQPWMNRKDIDVSCHNGDQRSKREAMTGGFTDQDPNDAKYRVLAEESLLKFVADSGTTQPLKVIKVEKVTTQVVSGLLTRIDFVISGGEDINKCHSKIWEQPWMNRKDIDVSCHNGDQRSKREAITGGSTEKDPNDAKYRVLAEESLLKFIADSGTTQPLKVIKVEKVTTQVVSGLLTRIDFVISGGEDINKCHSKIWEQPWMNRKDIDVSCHNGDQRSKREAITGGFTDQDPNDAKYRVLAEESLLKFVADSGTTQPLKVIKVEKVTTQVVSGLLTRIDFVISGGEDINKCHSKIWEQPWMNRKDIDVSCHNGDQRSKREAITGGSTEKDPNDAKYRVLAEESLLKFVADSGTTQPLKVIKVEKVTTQPWMNRKDIDVSCHNGDQRSKREAITGGSTEKDPNDAKYRVLAEESLLKFVADSGTTQPLKVIKVEKVTTQVVSGLLTRIDFVISGGEDINKCHSKIWEQPWMNRKDIDVSCHNGDQRSKREAITGGSTDKDPNDAKYRVLAEESLLKFVADSGTTQPLKVIKVEKVTTQVVSGLLTRIDFVISGGEDINKCHSKIWEQPWMNRKDIDVSCHNGDQRSKREAMTGGLTDQDPNDAKYRVLAEESLLKFVADSGTTQPLKVIKVEKVTTQVVSGLLTRIDFVISGGDDINKCHSKIWEQPWMNRKDIDVSCHNGDQRSKREAMTGGLTDQDPNDAKYRVLAEESLLKFVADSGTNQPLKVVKVEKVTTQVVSGLLTRIDFTISDGNSKTMKCHSKIFEQVWVERKEVNVDCVPVNIRARRDLGMPRGLVEQNFEKKSVPRSSTGNDLHNVRGDDEEDQNPNKPEYKLLVEESLRKFQQKSGVYHKVLEVKRVLTRVVSGIKYNIDFTAAPTACSVNESRVNARTCKTDDEVILYCHTEIWDRPWLRKKNIDVQCNDPSDDRDDFVEDDSDVDVVKPENESNNSENHMKLANEATEKYLTASNRKYVHQVTGIQSVSEQQLDGTFTIDFTISPTTCLRNVTKKDSCKVKQPVVVFHCNAKIRNKPWGNNESEIEVTCKKASERVNKSKKNKRDIGVRSARQTVDDAEEMDEDIIYYYADRALQHVNDHSRSNNLHKLISIHAVQSSLQMGARTVKMYIEIAETYCLRHQRTKDLANCEELNGLSHRLCLARLWPAPDEELITRHVSVVCDDDEDFVAISGVNVPELLRLSMMELEKSAGVKYKLVHQGEPQVIPSLDSRQPFKINFVVAYTNCSVEVDLDKNPFQCYINHEIPSKSCHSFIWLKTEIKSISYINVKCTPLNRLRRSTNQTNLSSENEEIKSMVAAALEKLEMSSLHRYKQRVLQINSHSTKITSGKVTTIDFDVGYTSCLKYEWVENITSCDFLEHLPRRRCVAQIWERLWIKNGQNIDVNCVDDETPLESHIEFESAEMANALAREALKHIEAKYPHPSKQKIVRIFSLEKQVVAGIHYKMKIEVGFTDCVALSDQTDCKLIKDHGLNKFCRVNVWVRPWTDHPPNFRVSCDFQEGATHDLYHHVQAEQLFYNFLTTYSPSYVNDYSQMQKRFEIFKNNIKKIHEFNVHEKGTAIYGVTRFADLTYEEFSSIYMGLNTNLTNENQVPMKKADIPDIKIPDDFDWREHDAVTEVKDQGSCGSCWAFSVTGNIEGQWKMQSGQLISLSEQELVDCDKLDDGCNGGLPDNAYRAIEQMGGLELESDYPYEGVGEKCEFNKTLAKVQISGAVNITTNETGMAQWLVHNGPISIGINANAMQFYMGGISHPWKMLCNPTNLDHGVLIVGYGIKDYPLFHKKLPYWIIKNSWGKSWGEQGYYRVYRGDGTCGVNQMASSAII